MNGAFSRMKCREVPFFERFSLGFRLVRHTPHPEVATTFPGAFFQPFGPEHVGERPSCLHVRAKRSEQLKLDFRFHPHRQAPRGAW
jgi:hypothetical protein